MSSIVRIFDPRVAFFFFSSSFPVGVWFVLTWAYLFYGTYSRIVKDIQLLAIEYEVLKKKFYIQNEWKILKKQLVEKKKSTRKRLSAVLNIIPEI